MLELTIAVPVYNEEYAIIRAISSILNQSWQGLFEILIVDDASTDKTADVVLEIGKQFPVIRLVRHVKNRGRPAARNTLAREARGKWFAMLDADDEWYPDKLKRQFELISDIEKRGQETTKLMVCGNIHHVDVDKGTERVKNFFEGYGKAGYDVRRVLKGDNSPISQLAILRTSFLRDVGNFDSDLRRAQDWDFLIRFFLKGGRVEFLPDPPLAMFNFRRSGRDPDVIEACMMRVIDKHHAEYARHGLDAAEVRASIQGYIASFREELA
jgi:glycosyltransferase involved in cell wall biosynthesis